MMRAYRSAGKYYHKSGYVVEKYVEDIITLRRDDEILHRLDGPAFEGHNGDNEWWINDKIYTNFKDFQIAGCLTDDQITILILKYGEISSGSTMMYDVCGNEMWRDHNNVLHRLDGPALIVTSVDNAYLSSKYQHGDNWYVQGVRCDSFDEFQRASYLSDDAIKFLKLKYGEPLPLRE